MSFKQTALKAAKAAGKIQLKYFGKRIEIRQKDKRNLVSKADLECEKVIISIIKKSFPSHNVISEETGSIDQGSDYTWFIDPLDGTHNYLHSYSYFGVSIALEKNKELLLGVIFIPLSNQLFVAEKGKGAFLNRKKIKVSDVKSIDKAFINFDANLNKKSKRKISILSLLAGKIFALRVVGCAVVNLSTVATGNADAYLALNTNPWDIAAGFLIVKEAGGKITDLKGKPVNHYSQEFIASNGKVHNQLLQTIKNPR